MASAHVWPQKMVQKYYQTAAPKAVKNSAPKLENTPPKPVVLKKRDDFVRLNKSTRRISCHSLVVQTAPNEKLGLRYGITVTKKTAQNATDRNRIKRRFRVLAHTLLPAIKTKDTDIVLIGKLAALKRPYEQLQKDLLWCLKKLDLI